MQNYCPPLLPCSTSIRHSTLLDKYSWNALDIFIRIRLQMFIKIVNRRNSLLRPLTREFSISVIRNILHIELGDGYVFLADGSSLIFVDVVVTF